MVNTGLCRSARWAIIQTQNTEMANMMVHQPSQRKRHAHVITELARHKANT